MSTAIIYMVALPASMGNNRFLRAYDIIISFLLCSLVAGTMVHTQEAVLSDSKGIRYPGRGLKVGG